MDAAPTRPPQGPERPPRDRFLRRRILIAAPALACAAIAILGIAAAVSLERAENFDVVQWLSRAAPLTVREIGREDVAADLEIRHLSIQDGSDVVRAELRVPQRASQRLGAIVILGGIDTGRRAVHLVPPDTPFVVASLDYAYDDSQHPGRLGFVRRIPAIRRGLLRTAAAYRDLVRYVAALPEVDARRVYVVGASLGSPLAATVAAERRPAGLVLLYGFADHAVVFEQALRPWVKWDWLRRRLAGWGGQLTAGFDAVRVLPRLCGVPVLVIESSNDQELPQSSREALWNAACAPRTRVELPGGHIRPRPDQRMHDVIEAVLQWLSLPETQDRLGRVG